MNKEENVIEKEIVHNMKMDNVTSFTTNIPVLQMYKIESDDEEVDNKPLPCLALMYGELNLISNHVMLTGRFINGAQNIIQLQHPNIIINHVMLTGRIINGAQNIIQLQHPNIAGLQNTLLGQSFYSKGAKDQKSFCFKKLLDQPFLQVFHNGNIYWLTISTINCLQLTDIMFRGKINHHMQW